jgi:hypothetical protein
LTCRHLRPSFVVNLRHIEDSKDCHLVRQLV